MLINNNFYRYTPIPPNNKSKSANKSFKSTESGEFRQKTIYGNDFHGHLKAFRQFKTAADKFRAENPNADVILSGDDWVGAYEPKNVAIVRLMNLINPTAVTLGNHNLDNKGSKGVSEMLNMANYKTLAINLQKKDSVKKEDYALQDDIDAGRLASSMVVEKNGTKIGYIGAVPTDMIQRISVQSQEDAKDIKILNLQETIKALQEEVNKLEKQGVKIIKLISHLGIDAEKIVAQNVSGIDEIFGGHSHDILDGLVQGRNLFKSPKGEWVIITQAGKNGHKYGELDVIYNAEGQIIKAKNELKNLEILPESMSTKLIEKMVIGAPKQIGTIARDVKSKPEGILEESPISSFLSDAYLKFSDADIVLNNMGGVRGSLPAGPITDREIIDIMPFFNDVHIYKLSEKDIVDTLNNAINATKTLHRTGAIQVSGMRYVIGADDKVKEAIVNKKDGTIVKLDVKNPSPNKFFKVAYNTYVGGNGEGLELLNAPEKRIEKCDLTETHMFIEYIKSFNGKPINIVEDGRIRKE